MKSQHKKSEYVLSWQEVSNLINSARTFEYRCILKCFYCAGMRVSEVANLEVQHIDFLRNIIHIVNGKGGKTRTIPFLDSAFKSDLTHFVGNKEKGQVFNIKSRMMQRVAQNTGKKAGISNPDPSAKHINPHLLRHSLARHLKSANYSIEFIQNFLGHSSYKTTMDEYGTLSINEMQQQVFRKTRDNSLVPLSGPLIPEIMFQGGKND